MEGVEGIGETCIYSDFLTLHVESRGTLKYDHSIQIFVL